MFRRKTRLQVAVRDFGDGGRRDEYVLKTKLNKSNFWLRVTVCFVTSAGSLSLSLPLWISDRMSGAYKYTNTIQIKIPAIMLWGDTNVVARETRESLAMLDERRDSCGCRSFMALYRRVSE